MRIRAAANTMTVDVPGIQAAELIEPSDVGVTEPALVTVPNVELLEVGQEWETSTGVFDFRYEDLVSCIASQDDPSLRTPVIKLGHVDPRFDGQPSLGRIENLRLTNNDQTLVGDFVGMPLWLAKVMFSAYPRRSIEGNFDVTTRTGNTWDMILTGVALLGDSYPAIDTLEDIQALWGSTPPPLYPVEDVDEIAASGTFFRARKVDDMPNWLRKKEEVAASSPVQASVSLDTVRRTFYDTLGPNEMWWWVREVRINPLTLIVDDDEGGLWEVPVTVSGSDEVTFGEPTAVKIEYVAAGGAPIAAARAGQIIAASHNTPEEAGRTSRPDSGESATMASGTDPSNNTEDTPLLTDEELAALGLEPGATREQISAAILGQSTQEGEPGDGNPQSQPETPATDPAAEPAEAPAETPGETQGDEPEVPAEDTQPSGVTVPEGMALVDAATLEEMRAGIAASTALVERQAKADRDAILDNAIRAGKFPKGRRGHYEALLSADPVGTKALIATLEPGVVPTSEIGEQGNEVAAAAEQTAYPSGWKRTVEAGRKTLGDRVKVVQD